MRKEVAKKALTFIKELISHKGITQAYLAESVGMERANLTSILSGSRSLTRKNYHRLMFGLGFSEEESFKKIVEWEAEELGIDIVSNEADIEPESSFETIFKESGMTQNELAGKSGIPQPNISAYLSGRRGMTKETAIKLLDGMGFSEKDAVEMYKDWQAQEAGLQLVQFDQNLVRVPRLGFASCGPFTEADIVSYDFFDRSLLNKKKRNYSMVANGVSMRGKIDHGDIVLVEQTENNLQGKIMLFKAGDEYAFGYLYEDEGFYEIRKANRDFPPMKVNNPEFQIIGVVRAVTKVNP